MGQRIKYIRNLRGMTQKKLGLQIGVPEESADIRVAQYETNSRRPREGITLKMADALDVCPAALTISDISSLDDIYHILFALEDACGFRASILDSRLCIVFDGQETFTANPEIYSFLFAWHEKANALKNGDISKKEYDLWRYNFHI